MVSRDTGGHGAEDKSYELGDLELAPAPRPSQEQPAVRFPKPRDEENDELPALATFKPSLPANDFDLGFQRGALPSDDDADAGLDEVMPGPVLELDLPVARAATVHSAPPTAIAHSAEDEKRGSSPQGSGRPVSASQRAERDLSHAARELADYGEAPAALVPSARYVLRVGLRAFALYRERREVEAQASERADVYEAALDALGRALLNDAEVCAHEGLREHVAQVEAKQRALAEVEAATRDVRARDENALEALNKARSAIEAELAPYLDEERSAAALFAKLESELKRKQAQLQRSDIELRALAKASLPPPPERLQGIANERQTREAELLTVSARHAEAGAVLARARRELSVRRGGLDSLERQHEARMAKARVLHGRLDADVSLAERALRAALCALAEAADKLEVPHTAADEIATVRSAEAALDERVELLTRYDRALSLYDRDALVRGALVWCLFAIAIALLVRMA